jgi:hypothetical protein
MKDDTTITQLRQPGAILDPLTEIAREGARQMLAAALRAEADSFVARFSDERLPDGRQRVVHHGARGLRNRRHGEPRQYRAFGRLADDFRRRVDVGAAAAADHYRLVAD